MRKACTKTHASQLKNFTGSDSPYERPDDAEITIDWPTQTPKQAARTILKVLESKCLIFFGDQPLFGIEGNFRR